MTPRRSIVGYVLVGIVAFVYTFVPAAAQLGERAGALSAAATVVALLVVFAVGVQEAWHGVRRFCRWLTR